MYFRFFSLKGYPSGLLRILNSFWKNQPQSCSCGICLLSKCGLLENKAELRGLQVLKNYFYPISVKPASSQYSNFAGNWESGVGGVESGTTDQGAGQGHSSAHTQLSKPNQLHFIRNL